MRKKTRVGKTQAIQHGGARYGRQAVGKWGAWKLGGRAAKIKRRKIWGCKAATGVGCDAFHPKVPSDLLKGTRGEIVKFLKKWNSVGDGRNKPARRCFPDCEDLCEPTPCRASAHHDSLVGVAGGPRCRDGRERRRVGWDASDGRNGGAERAVWETLLEMETFDYRAGETDQGAITLVLDLAAAFERVSLPVVWAWATHFDLSRKILRVECGCFEAAPDHHGHAPWVEVELLAPSHCASRCNE